MKRLTNYQACCYILLATLQTISTVNAASNNNVSDQRIRSIVESLLQEKDQKIEQLEARIKQLEQAKPAMPEVTQVKPDATKAVAETKPSKAGEPSNTQPAAKAVADAHNHAGSDDSVHITLLNKLGDLGEELQNLKDKAAEKGLGIRGFFDINAKTDNATDQNFSVGSVELDLEYSYNEHFAASSALILCGNSSGTDYAAPAAITCGGSGPGGMAGGGAGLGVAFVDYHMFDNSIPPRGRILNNQGFHIQAGRFDIPFGSDYQNFANTDRVTVTFPITSSRMQFGGFNGDGIRSYGSWGTFNYTMFWTDAMYATDGSSVGGRLGMAFGQNNYRSHKNNPEGIEFGVSYLGDLDKSRKLRHAVYGTDFSFGYGFLRLQSELMLMQSYNNLIADNGTDYGKLHEFGYHATLLADMEKFIKHPVILFARYGRWQPKSRTGLDYDGTLVAINNITALTFGLNYRFSDNLKLKFEYTDSLGTSTQERYFDKKLGIAQLVVSF